MKYSLTDQTGLSLTDINGKTTYKTTQKEREGIVAWIKRVVPWLDDPEPVEIRTVEEDIGMSQQELEKWTIYHNTVQEQKKEMQEIEQNRIKRRSDTQ